MKKLLMTVATIVVMVSLFAVSAFATVSMTYDIEDATTDTGVAVKKVVLHMTDDEGDWRALQTIIDFNYDKIVPIDWYDGSVPSYTGEAAEYPFVFNSFKNGRTSTSELQRPRVPVWTIDGSNSNVIIELYWPSPDTYPITASDTLIYEMYFKYADGVTVDDLTASDFKVSYVHYTNNVKYYYVGNSDETLNTIVFTNNVVPEPEAPVVITIPVLAGDKVYLQDGTVVNIDADNDAYEVPSTAGYIVVNSGKGEDASETKVYQQTYYVDGTQAISVHTNGVVGTDVLSLKDRTPVTINGVEEDRNGLRFKMTHNTEIREGSHKAEEVGFIMTAESNKVITAEGADYVLDMDMVERGYAKMGVAYGWENGNFKDKNFDPKNDILYARDIRAVFYNIPITEAGVQTVIASRPYYKIVNGEDVFYAYGEITKMTLYDAATAIKNNAESWAACSESQQAYIKEIIAQVEGPDIIVEDEVIIDIGGLYE